MQNRPVMTGEEKLFFGLGLLEKTGRVAILSRYIQRLHAYLDSIPFSENIPSPTEEPKPLGVHGRTLISEQAEKFLLRRGIPFTPYNIISALDNLGYFHRPIEEPASKEPIKAESKTYILEYIDASHVRLTPYDENSSEYVEW